MENSSKEARKFYIVVIIIVIGLFLSLMLLSKGPIAEQNHAEPIQDHTDQDNTNSFASFFDGVSVREDAEAIAPYFPWIQIEACQWQAVTLVNDRVPGPTDTLIWGCIAVSRDYLDEIIEKYDWFTYEGDYITMKTDLADANKPNLKYSPEYKKEHEGEQNGAAIQLYFDFDVGVLYFSGSL